MKKVRLYAFQALSIHLLQDLRSGQSIEEARRRGFPSVSIHIWAGLSLVGATSSHIDHPFCL